jgi:hypothetical protein
MPAVGELVSISAERAAALVMMGAPFSKGIWRCYPTADAVIDTARGVLFIAADMETSPGDWAAITGLIRAVGYDNGTFPHPDDPGEPEFDPISACYTWRLQYV